MTRPAGTTIIDNGDPHARARFVFIGVPTFGTVSISWHSHVMQLQNPLNRNVYHAYVRGFEVGQARNIIVDQALTFSTPQGHTASHVFFIDDDVLVPPYALNVLMAQKRPIVSGLYYAKVEVPQPLILMGPREGVLDPVPRNTVVNCYAHGMGCTLIETKVFRDLIDAGMVDYDLVDDGRRVPQFFSTTRDAMVEREGYPNEVFNQTEDVFFLNKAARLGYGAAVHTGVFSFHWDEKRQVGFPLHLWDEYKRTGNVTIGEEVACAPAS
jgi:hypothetical protein